MSNKKTSSQKIDESVAKSVNFEVTVADIAKRSERRAWWVAITAIVVALILLGGYFYVLPLKEKVPYVVMADAYTGTSSVARLTADLTNHQISTSEAINRSNVAHFVLARESYDVSLLNLHDWPTVMTMATAGVKGDYTTLYSQANPANPYKIYGKDQAIRIKILSIVLLGGGPGVTPKGATVRFQRILYGKLYGATQPLDNKIATLEFSYNTNLKMDDQYRIENPLGFQVTNYRVDNDFDSTPPAEAPASPANTLQGNQPQAPAVSGSSAGAVDALPPGPLPQSAAPLQSQQPMQPQAMAPPQQAARPGVQQGAVSRTPQDNTNGVGH